MKTREASKKALKHIICCLIILLAFVITITKVDAQNVSEIPSSETEEVVPLKPQLDNRLVNLNKIIIEESEMTKYNQPRIIEKNINYYINKQIDILTFLSNAFGYDINFVKENIIEKSNDVPEIEPTNIGSLKNSKGVLIKYRNSEYGAVEYFYNLVESHPEKRNKKVVPYSGDSDYVEKLIMYYTTNIYTNVDTTTALSIGASESGYYTVKYMLNKNNIYGGMSSNGLIRHENIEIGVLKYIRMLSRNYYDKGLTNIYSIGRVYCPIFNEQGNKIASPHWVNLVNRASKKYAKYTGEITIKNILEKKEI